MSKIEQLIEFAANHTASCGDCPAWTRCSAPGPGRDCAATLTAFIHPQGYYVGQTVYWFEICGYIQGDEVVTQVDLDLDLDPVIIDELGPGYSHLYKICSGPVTFVDGIFGVEGHDRSDNIFTITEQIYEHLSTMQQND